MARKARARAKRESVAAAPSVDAGSKPATEDVVLVHGVGADGSTLHVLRGKNDSVETGVLKPLSEGKPITGEVLRLKPRKEFPLLCDVEVELPAPGAGAQPAAPARSGPAQVANEKYRKNWDAIYRPRSKRSLAN